MRADVPVGLYLSGGVDSTIVLHYLSEAGITPRCFAIGFGEPGFDETEWAKRAASHYGATLTTTYVDNPGLDEVGEILDYFDEPFYDSSAVPTAMLNKTAAEDVKVVLGGDGGDEVFFGYKRYIYTFYLYRVLQQVPAPLRRSLLAIVRRLGGSRTKHNKFLRNALLDPVEALFLNSHDIGGGELIRDADTAGRAHAMAFEHYSRAFDAGFDPAGIFRGDVDNYLSCDILMKADRCSMMNSIEQRAPLLDSDLIRFAAELPLVTKLQRGEGKSVLKKVLARELGNGFAYRKKSGFRFPLKRFAVENEAEIRETIRTGLQDMPFDASKLLRRGFSDYRLVDLERMWKLFALGRFLCNQRSG